MSLSENSYPKAKNLLNESFDVEAFIEEEFFKGVETIFTKGQMQALGGELNRKTPVSVNVNVHNNASGAKAYATSNQDNDGNVSIDVIIEQIESTIGKNISKGEGLSPILEQRYALNPAYGSYR